jgi:DNA-binding XRE family transcriptional regulator
VPLLCATPECFSLHDLLYSGHAMTEGPPRPDSALHLLGATIRQYRLQRGLSQHALAARIGLSRTYINQIEQGQRNPSIRAVLHIAAALETPISLLVKPLEAYPELYALPMEE